MYVRCGCDVLLAPHAPAADRKHTHPPLLLYQVDISHTHTAGMGSLDSLIPPQQCLCIGRLKLLDTLILGIGRRETIAHTLLAQSSPPSAMSLHR